MGQIQTFVSQRSFYLTTLYSAWGYLIVDGREPSGYTFGGAASTPGTALLAYKGLHGWTGGAYTTDVSMILRETWTSANETGAFHEQGFTLTGYTYHLQVGAAQRRFDFHEPHNPDAGESHLHTGDSPDEVDPTAPITVEDVFADFEQTLADMVHDGFRPLQMA